MIAISKRKILHYIPVRSLKDTKGMTPGLDTKDLRDDALSFEAADYSLGSALSHAKKAIAFFKEHIESRTE